MLLNVFWSILWKGASGQFYEKRLLVRERYMKLLLETFTYIAIKERVTCIITMQTVMRIMLCRKYHLHKCNRDTHLDNYNKNCHPHICCWNRKIYQHTSNRKYHLKTCKNATDVVTCIIAIESVSRIVPTETFTCRNGASLRLF